MIFKRYVARPGSRISDEQAEIYGKYLQTLEEEISGIITAEDIVSDAKRDDCPLHDYFVWDNNYAGDQYRLWQARTLTSAIQIIVTEDNSEESAVRLFHHVSVVDQETENETSGYKNFRAVMEAPDLREQIIRKALKEVNSWMRRYSIYKELTPIFSAIEEIEKDK